MLTDIARLIVGSILIFSGLAKARAFGDFKRIVTAYGLIRGRTWLTVTSFLVVLMEIGFGVTLLVRLGHPWVELATLALLVGFSTVVGITLLRGVKDIPCGCMGTGRNQRIGWHVSFRNGGLICLLVPSVVDVSPWAATGGAILLLCCGLVTVDVGRERITASSSKV